MFFVSPLSSLKQTLFSLNSSKTLVKTAFPFFKTRLTHQALAVSLLSVGLLSSGAQAGGLEQTPHRDEVSYRASYQVFNVILPDGKLNLDIFKLGTAQEEASEAPKVAVAQPPALDFLTEEEEEQQLMAQLQEKTQAAVEPRDRGLSVGNTARANRGLALVAQGKPPLLTIPVQNARISSRFGPRKGRQHTGTDFAAPMGANITSSAPGTVVASGWAGGYGNMVLIDHGNGLQTRYGHCSKLLVKQGQKVSRGQIIAKVGNTGHSTGPHLHYEVITNGVHHNPERYLFR